MKMILEKMTEICCFVNDFRQANRQLADWRFSENRQATFSDLEVATKQMSKSFQAQRIAQVRIFLGFYFCLLPFYFCLPAHCLVAIGVWSSKA